MNRIGQPVQVRVVPSSPASVASSSSSSQKQLNIDVRLNVDIESGKVRLSVPQQQGTDYGLLKPATSSTQPAILTDDRSSGSAISRHSNRSQQQLHVGVATVQKPPE